MREEAKAELDELAASRARATGKPVIVVAFSGATGASVYDADLETGENELAGVVPLLEPNPGEGPPAKGRRRSPT